LRTRTGRRPFVKLLRRGLPFPGYYRLSRRPAMGARQPPAQKGDRPCASRNLNSECPPGAMPAHAVGEPWTLRDEPTWPRPGLFAPPPPPPPPPPSPTPRSRYVTLCWPAYCASKGCASDRPPTRRRRWRIQEVSTTIA